MRRALFLILIFASAFLGLASASDQGTAGLIPSGPVRVGRGLVEIGAENGRLVFQQLDAAGNAAGEPWILPREGSDFRWESPQIVENGGHTWLTFVESGADGKSRSRTVALDEVFLGLPQAATAEATFPTEPAVRLVIEAPGEGAAVGASRPAIGVRFSTPSGLPVDAATLLFTRGGQPLEVDCKSAFGGAECTPLQDFADGEATIEATVADVVGHLSPPAATRFVVDTREPELVFTSPEEGFLAGQATLLVSGYLTENATLELGETAIEVGPDGTFLAEVPLAEGPNVLIFTATDKAGNATVAVLTGLADTQPPQPLAPEAVAATRQGARIELAGAPGAAEAEARVRWRNQRTGQEVETFAQADGSFETALAAAEGDLLVAMVVDALDHTSLATEFPLALPAAPALVEIADAGLPAPEFHFELASEGGVTGLEAFAIPEEGSAEGALVRAAAIDRGNGQLEQPEVDGELPAMVVEVVHHQAPEHGQARNGEDHPVAGEGGPSGAASFVGQAGEVSLGLGEGGFESRQNLIGSGGRWRVDIDGGGIDAVERCQAADGTGYRGDVQRQLADGHRSRMGTEIETAGRNTFQKAASGGGFLLELGNQGSGKGHRKLLSSVSVGEPFPQD